MSRLFGRPSVRAIGEVVISERDCAGERARISSILRLAPSHPHQAVVSHEGGERNEHDDRDANLDQD
jgi:hypothetical protein